VAGHTEAVTEDEEPPAATITPYPDGPLIVRGRFELRTVDGVPIDPHRRTVALCRCGRSAIKPFCDGSHKRLTASSRDRSARSEDAARTSRAPE
jgi:CDGSH-type Zn-finger protein